MFWEKLRRARDSKGGIERRKKVREFYSQSLRHSNLTEDFDAGLFRFIGGESRDSRCDLPLWNGTHIRLPYFQPDPAMLGRLPPSTALSRFSNALASFPNAPGISGALAPPTSVATE